MDDDGVIVWRLQVTRSQVKWALDFIENTVGNDCIILVTAEAK